MSLDTLQSLQIESAITQYLMDTEDKCISYKDGRWTVISQKEISVDFCTSVSSDEPTEIKKIGSATLCFDTSSLEKIDETFERAVKNVYAFTARGFAESFYSEDCYSKLLSQLNIFKRQITENPDAAPKHLLEKYKMQLATIERAVGGSTEEKQILSDCKFMISLIEKILLKKPKVPITFSHTPSKVASSLPSAVFQPEPALKRPLSQEDFVLRYPFLEKDSLPPQLHLQRFRNINQYFGLNTFVQVEGDGNCFFYSVASGVLNKLTKEPSYKEALMAKIQEYQAKSFYVLSTTANKDEDMRYVLENLAKQTPESLFFDEKFNGAFSRILRFILSVEKIEGVDNRCGQDTEMSAVEAINHLFGLSAKVAVIEGAEYLDGNSPENFVIVESMIDQAVVTPSATAEQPWPVADFIIFRKSGHFFAGIIKILVVF